MTRACSFKYMRIDETGLVNLNNKVVNEVMLQKWHVFIAFQSMMWQF